MSGWRYRGYLPHVDYPHLWQSVTFRLVDSVPRTVVERWQREIEGIPSVEREKTLRHLIDKYEDSDHGACVLRDDHCAAALMEQLAAEDQSCYRIAAWVIMPNHVHVLVGPTSHHRIDLSRIMGKWKGASSRRINQILGRTGPLWQTESFDRWVRDDQHFRAVVAYIAENPVKAGLCRTASEWRWSHAWQGE
jgi:REP element-mobilizing transposase RayT